MCCPTAIFEYFQDQSKRAADLMSKILIPMIFMIIFVTEYNFVKLNEHDCIVKSGESTPFVYFDKYKEGPELDTFLRTNSDYFNVTSAVKELNVLGAVMMALMVYGGLFIHYMHSSGELDKKDQIEMMRRKSNFDAIIMLVMLI